MKARSYITSQRFQSDLYLSRSRSVRLSFLITLQELVLTDQEAVRQADEERRARLCPSTLRASHVLIARRGQKGRPRGFSKRSGSGGGRSRARQPDQAHGALSGLSCGHGHVRHRGQVRAGSSRAKPHDRHDLPVKRAALAQERVGVRRKR